MPEERARTANGAFSAMGFEGQLFRSKVLVVTIEGGRDCGQYKKDRNSSPRISQVTVPEVETPAPIDRLRAQLLGPRGRFAIIAAALVIWGMDTIFSRFLIRRGALSGANADTVTTFETVGTVIFVVTVIILIIAVLIGATHMMIRIIGVYLAFSVIQVIISVISMLTSATNRNDEGLSSLWDVAAMYALSVTVFTFVYVFLDVTTPRGAFVWPARDGEEAPTPTLVDYVFISLNVNSTYGPTSEAVMSRPTKLVMGLQVLLAILMLTVLIARAVSATGN